MDARNDGGRPPGDFGRLMGAAMVCWVVIYGGQAVFWWIVRETPPNILIPAAAVFVALAALGFLLGALSALGDWLRAISRGS